MFEAAETGRRVAKSVFNELAPDLRVELLELQQRLRGANFPVIIVFSGVDGAGKTELVNLLNEWMDPRWLISRAYERHSDEESERPEYWRYWRDLPPKGRFGLFLSCWYTSPLLDRVYKRNSEAKFDQRLERIADFERTLADDGALILKFWMHLGKNAQKQRLKKLEKAKETAWQVTKTDWKNWKNYDQFISAAERLITRTSTGSAPWTIVEGQCPRYRALTVINVIQERVEHRLAEMEARKKAKTAKPKKTATKKAKATGKAAISTHLPTILDTLDMENAKAGDDYGRTLKRLRGQLAGLYRQAKAKGVSSVLVFEGWDAAGKGGAIRRLTPALQASDYQVNPVAAPTDEERAQHYLWRFWRQLGRAGRLNVFDRSWYGRVLVERVEGFAGEDEWRRAYKEIRDFEQQLVDHGIVLCKYWVHITKEEQLARFKAREKIPYKKWKLTDEDWRNRKQWDLYEEAVNEMVARTSTQSAPWTLVEGNDKKFARLKVIRTYIEGLEARLKE